MLGDVALRKHLPGASHEKVQQAKLLLGQRQYLSVAHCFARHGVEPDATVFQHGAARSTLPTEQRVQTGEQLFKAHRLDYEIVGPCIETFHLVLPAAARREDENRAGHLAVTPVTQEVKPAAIGKAEIKDDAHKLVKVGPCLAFGARARDIDGKACPAQPLRGAARQLFVIFDQQYAQPRFLLRGA